MPITIDIDVVLARRKMAVGELAERVGITPANLTVPKNDRAKAVRPAVGVQSRWLRAGAELLIADHPIRGTRDGTAT
jgi:hypothetical protein